jgi:hypothetical protein
MPADVYHGCSTKTLKMTEEIKKQTIRNRRLQHPASAAQTQTEIETRASVTKQPTLSKKL